MTAGLAPANASPDAAKSATGLRPARKLPYSSGDGVDAIFAARLVAQDSLPGDGLRQRCCLFGRMMIDVSGLP
jgi:hypothetical protein